MGSKLNTKKVLEVAREPFPGNLIALYQILRFALLISVCLTLLGAGSSLNGATLPSGFTETPIATGLSSPTAMDFAPDGRLFICLQGGQLRVIKNGVLLATPFLTVTVDSSGERGLLGIAFDPNFQTNNFLYVYYTTTTSSRHNRVSRFTANGDVALAGSELTILDLDPLSAATNHNGGAIHFGPDGKLYVAVGENANPPNSQTLSNLLGKVLRINSDGTIPSDNPFYTVALGNNRAIWALGLRNPFTFAFQPGSGRLFINDVGQNTWEEINDGIAGSNYGWPNTEGATSNPMFRSPLFSYGHGGTSTTGCAIAGGTFYNPAAVQFPSTYVGKYFFADLCTGWIRMLNPSDNAATDFATGINQPVDLKVGADGSLYYLSIGSAAVFKIQFPSVFPRITGQPSDQSLTEGQTATFQVTAAGNNPLSYQWQRNRNNIAGANTASYNILAVSLTDNGAKFRCVVSNVFGTVTSSEATLTVTAVTPVLVTQDNTDRAVALDSVNMLRDPFALVTTFNFSLDHRTRIMLFATSTDLLPGENSAAVTAQAEDAQQMVHPLTVEFVGKVPGFNSLTEVVVRFPDNQPVSGDVLVSITLHGKTSNKARVTIQ